MKIGKTTLAVQFPRNLLLAVEHGYNAIDGIMAADVPTWAEFKKYVKQLQDEEVKGMFDSITIDTVGLLYERCESYVCDREGVDKIGDIPYGAGFKMVDKEFEESVRKITQICDKEGNLAYGICFIGHEKVRVETDGQASVKHVMPDVSDRCAKIINRMVDITAYIGMEDGKRYIYPRQTSIIEGAQTTDIYAGSHFSNLNNRINLSYEALVNAIADAMQYNVNGNKVALSDAPVAASNEIIIDFNETKTTIGKYAKLLKKTDDNEGNEDSKHLNAYKEIVERYLGKGKLVKETEPSQVEILGLIKEDLEDYLKINNIK